MVLIITHSRKELVRKQKAIVDYVDKHSDHPTSPEVKEAFADLQKWNDRSGIFKDKRGNEHIASFEKERRTDEKETS